MPRAAPRQGRDERRIHLAVLAWLRAALPGAVIHHSANEIGLSGPEVARQIAKARHMGMVKGFPDLLVLYRGQALFLEVKDRGVPMTPEQRAFRDAVEAQGFRHAVVRSTDDAQGCLAAWGIPIRVVVPRQPDLFRDRPAPLRLVRAPRREVEP